VGSKAPRSIDRKDNPDSSKQSFIMKNI